MFKVQGSRFKVEGADLDSLGITRENRRRDPELRVIITGGLLLAAGIAWLIVAELGLKGFGR